MKILDKYILREFLKPFLVILFVVTILSLLIKYIDEQDYYRRRIEAGDKDVGKNVALYYLYRTPEELIQILPVAILFAVSFAIGQFVRYNEIIAIFVGGISLFRFVRALFVAGFILSIIHLISYNTLIPLSSQKADFYRRTIRHIRISANRRNVNYNGRNGYLYYFEYLDYPNNTLRNFFLTKLRQDNTVEFTFKSEKAVYNRKERVWTLFNGRELRLNKDGTQVIYDKIFEEKKLKLRESIDNFAKEQKKIEYMTIFEVINRLRILKQGGLPYRKPLVELHKKIAFPFVSLIIIFLGISIAPYTTKSVMVLSFGLTVIASAVYLSVMGAFISFGNKGLLPPFFAAWTGNFIFILMTLIMIKFSKW